MALYEKLQHLTNEIGYRARESADSLTEDEASALRQAQALVGAAACSAECRAKPGIAAPGESETELRRATGMDTWVVVRVEKDGVAVDEWPEEHDVLVLVEDGLVAHGCEKVVIIPTRGEWTHYTRLYEQTITSTNPLD